MEISTVSNKVTPRVRILAIRLIYIYACLLVFNFGRRDYLSQNYLYAAFWMVFLVGGVVAFIATIVPDKFPKYGKYQRQVSLATDIDTAYAWMSTALVALAPESELLMDRKNLTASVICKSTIRSLGEQITGTVCPDEMGVTCNLRSESIWIQMPDYGKNWDNLKNMEKALRLMEINSIT